MTGVLNRARAVQSGQLEYRFTFGRAGSDKSPVKQLPVKVFTFAGSDSMNANATAPRRRCLVVDASVQYGEIQMPKGRPESYGLAATLRCLERLGRDQPPSTVAGTFWHSKQRDYVESHRTQFSNGGSDHD